MVVMDDASMHKIAESNRSVELNRAKDMMIPGGITRYLKLLDVLTDKPFKELNTMNIV